MQESNHPLTVVYPKWFKVGRLHRIPQPCAIVVDSPQIIARHMPTVFIHMEPRVILPHVADYLKQNHARYHTIFTFDETVLRSCPNARFYAYGTTWLPEEVWKNVDVAVKKPQISHLCGTKLINNAPGHVLRQQLYYQQTMLSRQSPLPITFFRSSDGTTSLPEIATNPTLPSDTKLPLFREFQFAFVIENSQQQNYFTEKLIDCLLTKTIPIYFGCPNIADFFNVAGWILFPPNVTMEEVIRQLQCLSHDYYSRYIDVIEANWHTARSFAKLEANLNK